MLAVAVVAVMAEELRVLAARVAVVTETHQALELLDRQIRAVAVVVETTNLETMAVLVAQAS
jgi:hypothetical protein